MKRLLNTVRKPETLFFLVVILSLAAFLRLYRIGDYMTFLGDEGRDALAVYNILHGDFTLLGPRSSAADFYYGPIYFYLISPFLYLFNYSPVGPSIFVALVGIATVYLIYKVGTEFFGRTAGAIAACLYAISPLVIAYSRSSWNPNPLPFVSLLSLYLLYKGITTKNKKLFIVVGVLLGLAMQFQYLSLFLALIMFVYIAIAAVIEKNKFNETIFQYLRLLGGFFIGFSPFLGFEVLHKFPNTKTIINFILVKNPSQANELNITPVGNIIDVFYKLFGRLISNFPPREQININQDLKLQIWQIGIYFFIFISIFFLIRHKNKLQKALFMAWLLIGVFLFGFYKKQVYDYYMGFMFPLPFLLIGNGLSSLGEKKLILKSLSIILFAILVWLNFLGIPFQFQPNRQLDQVKEISNFVLSKTNGRPFNFALITGGNSDHGYRYFFKTAGRDPVVIQPPEVDPARKSVTDQLLIVCEDPNCRPLGNSLWEVAGFGRAEVAGGWNISVVKVYKLTKYQGI